MAEVIAKRQFTTTYIVLDVVFLILLAVLLFWKKKYATLIVGASMGVLYMIVDYGIFHLLCHARSIEGGSLFWVLLWMSVSYGFTNFAWIWLWISKDKHLFEWSFLILSWWFSCPLISKLLPAGATIIIQRTTGEYHGYMAVILFVGYLCLIIYNLHQKEKQKQIPILWLLIIGVFVQFGWEAGLLIGGIRSTGFGLEEKLAPLIVNSLLETNLGMPIIYGIYLLFSSRRNEDLSARETRCSLAERIAENHQSVVR